MDGSREMRTGVTKSDSKPARILANWQPTSALRAVLPLGWVRGLLRKRFYIFKFSFFFLRRLENEQ